MEVDFDKEKVLGRILDEKNLSAVLGSKILIVGSGGIGVEIIKNVILLGFHQIVIIDLDTIDVSNLNRQFLFNKSHVGKPKSIVAANVSLNSFAFDKEKISITPIEGSIMNQEYDVEFFRQFKVVINALDNRAARSHVNRMCLAANVPLIESGSEGYLGQVFLIKRNVSSCYECDGPRKDQKTYASCTIRNTPSLPIHCIVWGKHLFAQLFGEEDPDNDVSPDTKDPEIHGNSAAGGGDIKITNGNCKEKEIVVEAKDNEEITSKDEAYENSQSRTSTRLWAVSNDYNPELLFTKLFETDIQYLLTMDKLWISRRKPIPLSLSDIENNISEAGSSTMTNGKRKRPDEDEPSLKDQKLWTLKDCFDRFKESVEALKSRLSNEKELVWDKDDDKSLDFVTAVSNLRCHIFGIERKSRFDVKSMAGNIIPAISSTNSIIGGLITLQLVNLLRKLCSLDENESKDQSIIDKKCYESCRCIYLRKLAPNAKNLISSYQLFEPNSKCMICSGNTPEFEIIFDFSTVTMADFVEQIIVKRLNFVCPDIGIDGQPIIIFSKEDSEDYTDEERSAYKKNLLSSHPHIKNKIRLKIDDLLQNLRVIITLKDEMVDAKQNDGNFYSLKCTSQVSA